MLNLILDSAYIECKSVSTDTDIFKHPAVQRCRSFISSSRVDINIKLDWVGVVRGAIDVFGVGSLSRSEVSTVMLRRTPQRPRKEAG